ncbi:MAG: hypothetical protein R3330_01740 [Saprospiraceae bacterium]|nr:hypothetical protein [Saprospiraceae bacterium]
MKIRFLPLMLLVALTIAACSNQGEQSADSDSNAPVEPQNTFTVTPFSPSHSYPDAAITSMEYVNGTFTFGIGGESYRLGVQTPDAAAKGCANSAQGQHIHLIVDNLPYAAKYESTFDYEIPDGEHHILAFLSRSYHESIKTSSAHMAVKAMVKNNSITSSEPIDMPMLFYSRPKGVYTGTNETERVMLDYYLVNADPADYTVEADINGEIHQLDGWRPYYVEGLPAGENTIKLTLKQNGERVKTDLNPVTRKFVLNPDPEG